MYITYPRVAIVETRENAFQQGEIQKRDAETCFEGFPSWVSRSGSPSGMPQALVLITLSAAAGALRVTRAPNTTKIEKLVCETAEDLYSV